MTNFAELGLCPPLLQAVDALGFTQTTPIQAGALPAMLAGHDVRAQAKTGSGKTAAFGLALLAGLDARQTRLNALVLCPTRELADQVSKDLRALARFIPNVKILSLCGGISLRPQLASLSHTPHIAVGTPGRILDLIRRQALDLSALSTLVLDEADRMLDMGFLDAVETILKRAPKQRRTWLFSATYPAEISALSTQFQNQPQKIMVDSQHDAEVITQQFFRVERSTKPAAVMALLVSRQPASCLIFCNTKIDARQLTASLREHGVAAMALHGDLDQRDREDTLMQFANGSCRVLVATDVAARGLDIKALPMVIAYELPNDPDVHIHRIGRTGRAGGTGLALTLVAQQEMGRLVGIEAQADAAIQWSELPVWTRGTTLPAPTMQTLVIDAGRKDKLRPGDILGALTGAAGLDAKQIGKIDVFATRAYVAIDRRMLKKALQGLRGGKIKGRKFRLRTL